MDWTIWMFLTVVVVVFGLVMIAAGAFSAYFGKGKTRGYGVTVAIVGLIALLAWFYLTQVSTIDTFTDIDVWDTLYTTLIGLIAVIVGALVAVGIFLVTVLKS